MKINNQLTIKLYSVLLPFLPILVIYGLPHIGKLTLADIILLALAVSRMLASKGFVKLDLSLFYLMLYILVHPLFLSFYTDSASIDWGDTIGTSFRLAFYIAMYGVVFYKVAYKSDVIASFRIVGCISVIYGILQFIAANLLGISLSPYIPFLHVVSIGLEDQQAGWIRRGVLVRVRSWFSEPSAFSMFLLLALCIELTLAYNHKQKVSKFVYLYIVGIMISCSSTGFIGLLFTYTSYVLFIYKLSKKRIIEVILFILLFTFIAVKSGYIDFTLNHMFASGKGLQHQSNFSSIPMLFQNKMNFNFCEIFFGHGMQQIIDNDRILAIPGWLRTFYCLGIFGVMFYVLSFFTIFRKLDKNGKLIIVLLILLSVGKPTMLGIFSILYMTVAMINHTSRRK